MSFLGGEPWGDDFSMGARRITALAMVAGLIVAGPAWSQALDAVKVLFLEHAGQRIELKADRARAYDTAGKPLFEAGLDYIRDYAENPGGRVYEWDVVAQRVRISAEGQEPVWLKCIELMPMSIACGPALRTQGALIVVGQGEIPERFRPPPPRPPSPGDSPFGTLPNTSGTGKGSGYAAGPARGVPFCPGDPRCRKVKRP